MESIEIGKIVEAGLAFTLAAVVIYWYRSDSLERLKNADERTIKAEKRTEQERDDKLMMVEIVRSNTAAMTRLEAALTKQERRNVREDEREGIHGV